jgi:50S ribosomal subunit-associated GTPase HflX
MQRRLEEVQSEELHNFYSSPNIIRHINSRKQMGGACGAHGRGEKSVQGFSRKARRKEATRKTEA